MALPQTEHPLIDVHIHSLNKSVKFRPFLVKEEKLLVLASESKDQEEMVKATQQVITNCSFGKVQGDELPIFDMQKIFLELRKVSVSDTVSVRLQCGACEAPTDMDINLDTFELIETEGHSLDVTLADDITVKMRYPDVTEMLALGHSETEKDIYAVAEQCIEIIYYGDSIIESSDLSDEEKTDFVDNLTSEQFRKLQDFFETMPAIENEIKYTCRECEKENTVYMNGYYDFFA
tara:strand:- start:283 stop:984 length:702 start_codon:yes stop_codon:yes gene_type:complete